MSVDRETMVSALTTFCLPVVRKMGFVGTFPNFYRETGGYVALLSFQFHSSGGSFCVTLGYADPKRLNVSFEPETAPASLRVGQTRDRVNLGAPAGGDNWFCYGPTRFGEVRGKPDPANQIAARCAQLLMSEAEPWWRKKRAESGRSCTV